MRVLAVVNHPPPDRVPTHNSMLRVVKQIGCSSTILGAKNGPYLAFVVMRAIIIICKVHLGNVQPSQGSRVQGQLVLLSFCSEQDPCASALGWLMTVPECMLI